MADIHKRFKAKQVYPRLDHFLNEFMGDVSRNQIGKSIKEGHVKVNDNVCKKKSFPIEINDIIDILTVIQEPKTEVTFTPTLSFDSIKLYEDEYLLVIDKPAGITVHPGSGITGETILDIFKHHYPQIATMEIEESERPGIVHRLDKETSGVMILAKDLITMRRLQKQFKRRNVKKTYMAFATGEMRYRNGTIDLPLTRSLRYRTKFRVAVEGEEENAVVREAVTRYSLVRQFDGFCFVKLFPLTGRTHQLRVHLAHSGNFILGDNAYGKSNSFSRLALHAYKIEFQHPTTKQLITTYSPLPKVFRNFLKKQFD
jgi:23S rRNA pseudouridine1911/1915/1917 synthase